MLLPLNFDLGQIWTSEDAVKTPGKNATNRTVLQYFIFWDPHEKFAAASLDIAQTQSGQSQSERAHGAAADKAARKIHLQLQLHACKSHAKNKPHKMRIQYIEHSNHFSTKICVCMRPSPCKLFQDMNEYILYIYRHKYISKYIYIYLFIFIYICIYIYIKTYIYIAICTY